MATLNLNYSTGIDQYVDQEEDLLLAHYRGETKIKNATDSLFYLTTKERENILSWYPFNNKEVLEIGSGCGCITGVLCENNKHVVSVDQSQKRAQITYERHKNRGNLDVYAGNINNIPFDRKFDYIILIGVLEYSKRFFSEYPQDESFLKIIRNLLKPEGVLLIAIENRFGIKYFAGADEDHLGAPYTSITGYSEVDVQTYGKKELETLLTNCGFSKTNFYYPFPDYKLPSIIYSEKQIPSFSEASLLPTYTYGKPLNFSAQQALQGLVQNEQFGFFANSFLVEAGTTESLFSNVTFAKFQPKRTEQFQIVSIQREGKQFVKVPRTSSAKQHLENYEDLHNKLDKAGLKICKVRKFPDIDEWHSEYVNGKSIPEQVETAGKRNGKEGIQLELRRLVDYFYSVSEYVYLDEPTIPQLGDIYKEKAWILKYGLMDLNASNLLYHDEAGYIIIDQEWEENKQVPTDYAIMNSIGYIFSTCPTVRTFYSLTKLLEEFNLSQDKVTVLNQIPEFFFKKENYVLDEEKHIIFDQLDKYEINENYSESSFLALSAHTKKIEDELHRQNEQVAFLSEHYNRVVEKIRVLENQLYEKNDLLTDLSNNYNRVVKILQDFEDKSK